MSANNSEADGTKPRTPDTVRARGTITPDFYPSSIDGPAPIPDTTKDIISEIPLIIHPNGENGIADETDFNGSDLAVNDEKSEQVEKDTTLSQAKQSNEEYVRLIGGLYLDYLDEMEKTFHAVPSKVEEIEIIIIKKAHTGV